ncbi:tubulin-specific chaperone D [Achlya hypogyna]|uniref:Tubulin-specific chaperone D n=1 Tax=Achlya hypogyna TaxID=1202772 RepID=A0A1V9ZM61_ACHHY|nr:tubulin-specific chaperone D [Achlya hypogyna]
MADESTAVNEIFHADKRLLDILQEPDLSEECLDRFRVLLEPYQEQGGLLDPILRDMVTPVMERIRAVIHSLQTSSEGDAIAFPFQVLQDPAQREVLHRSCQVIYLLCKVRGYKTIVKLLSHEVSEFEPVLLLLQSQDRDDCMTWEIRYVLLLWLSILALVPFDLKTVDSSLSGHETTDTVAIVANIITICKMYLQDSGATQQAAALCLARLLRFGVVDGAPINLIHSRPDMEERYLKMFLVYVKDEFAAFCAPGIADISPKEARIRQYRITGIMLSLSYICKFTPRDQHIVLMGDYFAHVMRVVETIQAQDSEAVVSSTLHRKLSTKLLQRMGLLYLPPKVMAWRYARGLRSLEVNLNLSGTTPAPAPALMDTVDGDIDVPEELEEVVDVLLCGLRDRDTVVRWSAAKGIGRITARLPYEFADDIVQSVLELFVPGESDTAWHGASLAIAELSRRCVLLPQRLPEAVRVVGRALMYDVRRGAHSIGAHVRDAACYACWSFARAYEPALLLPHLRSTLAPIMLTVCAFDRELNCRRAASAAFQESVGRQGVANFPHGIDLLTKADYFTLASVTHAFLGVSLSIAQYSEYRYALIDHLATTKVYHWDVQIRELAAKSLGQLCALDPAYAVANVLPALLAASISAQVDVIVRHGATMALTQVALQLAAVPAFLDGESMRRIKFIPLEMDKRRLYRGRGGELVRTAVCRVIEAVARMGWGLPLVLLKKYLATLEECIKNPNDDVRTAAIEAYDYLAARYLTKLLAKPGPDAALYVEAIVPRFITNVASGPKQLLNPNVAARRGFLRVLGLTPYAMLAPHAAPVVALLITAAVAALHSADEQDAESRVAAIQALVDVVTRNRSALEPATLERILDALLRCADDDYGTDERGDVGSWVRKEAMAALATLATTLVTPAPATGQPQVVAIAGFGTGTVVDTRELSASATVVHVQFERPSPSYYYFPPHGVGIFNYSRLLPAPTAAVTPMLPALAERTPHPVVAAPQELSFPPLLMHRFCRVLVKQLSEKLDTIRSVAGAILARLLQHTPAIEGIADRPFLEAVIGDGATNWAMAHETFPIVVKLLDSPEYMAAVAAGLVISVGGLTESVVKASKAATLGWLRTNVKAQNLRVASQFAYRLLELAAEHSTEDRVVVPLLKTLSACLEAQAFAFLHADGPLFGNAVYDAVRVQIIKTSDLPKISAGLSVLVGLLPSEATVEQRAFRGLAVFLGHRFPKVRKLAAEKLYTRLILHDELVDEAKYDEVLGVLSETAWDGEIADVRSQRDLLLELMGLEKIAKRAMVAKAAAAPSEAAASYETLVKEMGY